MAKRPSPPPGRKVLPKLAGASAVKLAGQTPADLKKPGTGMSLRRR